MSKFVEYHSVVLKRAKGVPWFVPMELGGLGLPCVTEYAPPEWVGLRCAMLACTSRESPQRLLKLLRQLQPPKRAVSSFDSNLSYQFEKIRTAQPTLTRLRRKGSLAAPWSASSRLREQVGAMTALPAFLKRLALLWSSGWRFAGNEEFTSCLPTEAEAICQQEEKYLRRSDGINARVRRKLQHCGGPLSAMSVEKIKSWTSPWRLDEVTLAPHYDRHLAEWDAGN
jgi:hypothetical protein